MPSCLGHAEAHAGLAWRSHADPGVQEVQQGGGMAGYGRLGW